MAQEFHGTGAEPALKLGSFEKGREESEHKDAFSILVSRAT